MFGTYTLFWDNITFNFKRSFEAGDILEIAFWNGDANDAIKFGQSLSKTGVSRVTITENMLKEGGSKLYYEFKLPNSIKVDEPLNISIRSYSEDLLPYKNTKLTSNQKAVNTFDGKEIDPSKVPEIMMMLPIGGVHNVLTKELGRNTVNHIPYSIPTQHYSAGWNKQELNINSSFKHGASLLILEVYNDTPDDLLVSSFSFILNLPVKVANYTHGGSVCSYYCPVNDTYVSIGDKDSVDVRLEGRGTQIYFNGPSTTNKKFLLARNKCFFIALPVYNIEPFEYASISWMGVKLKNPRTNKITKYGITPWRTKEQYPLTKPLEVGGAARLRLLIKELVGTEEDGYYLEILEGNYYSGELMSPKDEEWYSF